MTVEIEFILRNEDLQALLETAEGKEYEGTCRISKEGECYRLRWKIGEGTQVGADLKGTLNLAKIVKLPLYKRAS